MKRDKILKSTCTARARRCWQLVLPDSATRDDPWANPFGPSSPDLEAVALGRILVIAGGSEMSKDRIDDYGKRLTETGKAVEYKVSEGRYHNFLNDSYSETGGRWPKPSGISYSQLVRNLVDNLCMIG
ncbi:hypothetical protein NL676_016704 [Syzygium grande]|nr:hypothetical protein NL676_016704 [Syzygium grande]